jgi:hypothetical protein
MVPRFNPRRPPLCGTAGSKLSSWSPPTNHFASPRMHSLAHILVLAQPCLRRQRGSPCKGEICKARGGNPGNRRSPTSQAPKGRHNGSSSGSSPRRKNLAGPFLSALRDSGRTRVCVPGVDTPGWSNPALTGRIYVGSDLMTIPADNMCVRGCPEWKERAAG